MYSTRFFFLLLVSFSTLRTIDANSVVDLRCDYRVNPLAVDRSNPLLSWRMQGTRKGLAQSAYQIQAATSPEGLGANSQSTNGTPDLWDSGWVSGRKSMAIEYSGELPKSMQRVHWRVRVKDDRGKILPWSEINWFDVGLLKDGDWQDAKWVSCNRELQTEYGPADVMGDWIAVAGDAKAAETITYKFQFSSPDKHVVYAGGWWSHVDMGSIEIKVNGQKGLSGPEGPATIHYKDFSFQIGTDNEVSVTLSDAKSSTPISFGMKIVFADGSEEIIQSSADWQVKTDEEQNSVSVVCEYGQEPLGEAKISPRAPLAATWYKKNFNVSKAVSSARLYVCGLGYNEPYLNGSKVGDHGLDPGQSDYEKFAYYSTYDVKDQINPGENALSILLGDGWYNNDRWFSHSRYLYGKPGLRALLHITYHDGTTDRVITNDGWRWKQSGLTMSNLFLGDYMDYRLWDTEWEKPGMSSSWKPVQSVKPLSPRLIAQDFPPIRIVREIDPIKTWQVGEKTWVVDLGQNISGWVRLDFDEPAGTVIRMRCVEMLQKDETYIDNVPRSFWNCHASPQHHRIIADGEPHRWRPYFSYHGFRFAEIHGLSQAPKPGQIKGLVVHSDTPVRAAFRSSDPLLNRIFDMGIQTHLNNMHSVLEDCPHREKCQWGGDLHSSWATGYYTLDSASFYRQQVRVFYTPPFDRLGIPGRVGVGRRATNKTLDFTWSVSPLFLAWQNYQINGDLQTASDHYDEMLTFLRVFEKKSPDLLPHIHRYGDHAPPIGIPRTPADSQLIAALNFYAAADRFAVFAQELGKAGDAAWSRDLASRIRASINRNYFDAKNKTYGNGTHDSLALSFGVVDESDRDAVASSLAKIYQDNGKQFDGGFMSYYIYPELSKNGYVDLALDMLRNPDYPGIAQSIRDYDATTIFERFRNDSRQKQLNQSLDHHAMNHPTAWMLNYLAGIRNHPDETGMTRLLLAPEVPLDLENVQASLMTNNGLVQSEWNQRNGKMKWRVHVPPNSTAEVRLPKEIVDLRIDGLQSQVNPQGFEIDSGTYLIQWQKL